MTSGRKTTTRFWACRRRPSCLSSPVLTENDPDVLCGVLREDGLCGRTWIIYVDLKQLLVLSCVLYIDELIVRQRDAIDSEEYNSLLPFVPWLPSDIPRYLNQPQGNYKVTVFM